MRRDDMALMVVVEVDDEEDAEDSPDQMEMENLLWQPLAGELITYKSGQ